MHVADFDFELPEELIAQHPPPVRGQSRLLVLSRATGEITHARFDQIGEFLRAGDLQARSEMEQGLICQPHLLERKADIDERPRFEVAILDSLRQGQALLCQVDRLPVLRQARCPVLHDVQTAGGIGGQPSWQRGCVQQRVELVQAQLQRVVGGSRRIGEEPPVGRLGVSCS